MERWASGEAYEQYVGRWSRKVATLFVRWLAPGPDLAWAEVGCGTGALTSVILAEGRPSSVRAVDSSQFFISQASQRIRQLPAYFARGDAAYLPWRSASCDVTVAGLALNFVERPEAMVHEMARVTRSGGIAAVYVWDYGSGMQMMRYFWDAAKEVSPQAARLDQAERFPICQPGPLQELFERSHLKSIRVHAIDIPTLFQNFDDYWNPFLGGTGAAPGYLASVATDVREKIRQRLQERLPQNSNGQIELTARAWAVQGRA